MTQYEFEAKYAAQSGMSIVEFRSYLIGLPCGCEEETCEGWAAVARDPDTIAEHLDFYSPDAPRTMKVGRFRKLGYRRT